MNRALTLMSGNGDAWLHEGYSDWQISFMGMCHCEGYGFQAVWSAIG